MTTSKHAFSHFAKWCSDSCGKPTAFVIACGVLAVWLVSGPACGYSDTWQLAINTGTTIVTFLMVFLIQNTQNRENETTQIKLDELIRAIRGAHNHVIDTDEESDEELERWLKTYKRLGRVAKREWLKGRPDTGTPDIQPDPLHGQAKKHS